MKTIVIIDDNTAIRHSLKRMLGGISNEGGSFKVYTSSNGVEGLGLIFTTKPDVIIIDLTLPKYSGREVIDYLVTNETLKKGSELIVVMHENSKYKESLPKEFKLIDKSKRNALNELDNHLRKVFQLKPNKEKGILNKSLLHVANQSDLLVESIRRSGILKKLVLYPLWFLSQVMVSIYLGVQNITGRNIVDNNIVQEEEDNKNLRVRTYPTIVTIFTTLLITFFQVSLFVSGGMVILNTRVESILALSQGEKGIEFIIEKESEFEYVAEEVEFKIGGVELKKQTREISVETGDEIEEVEEEPILQEQPIPDDTQEESLEIQQDDLDITVEDPEANQETTPDDSQSSPEELQPDTNDSPDILDQPVPNDSNTNAGGEDVLGVSTTTQEYYPTTKPFIITKTPVTYTKLDEILERSSINTDESSTQTVQEFNDYLNTLDPTDPKKQTKLTYQLSPDKKNWYYYSLESKSFSRTEVGWVSSNTIQEINEGLSSYSEIFPEGNLYLKVFIHTNNEEYTPSLKEIVIQRDTSILTNTDVEIPEDKKLEEETINTLDFNQLEVSIFNASYANGNKVVLGKLLLKEKNKKANYEVTQQELENYEAVVSYENGREIGRTNLYLNQRGEIEFLLITPEADGGYVVAQVEEINNRQNKSETSKPVENSTFTVDSTGDEADLTAGNGLCLTSLGTCTLRAAIQEANALAGADNIYFNIPTSDAGYRDYDFPDTPSSGDSLDGDDYWSIRPASAYPNITDTINLDGATQESNQGDMNSFGPDVEIKDRALVLLASAPDSTINKIVHNKTTAINSNIQVSAEGFTLTRSYIDFDVKANNVISSGGGYRGLLFSGGVGTDNLLIGGTQESGNYFGINSGTAIEITCSNTVTNNNLKIRGNKVGLRPDGSIVPIVYPGGYIYERNMCELEIGGELDDHRNYFNSGRNVGGGALSINLPASGANVGVYNNFFGTDFTGQTYTYRSMTTIRITGVTTSISTVKIGDFGKGNLIRGSRFAGVALVSGTPAYIAYNTIGDTLGCAIEFSGACSGVGSESTPIDIYPYTNVQLYNNYIGQSASDPYFGVSTGSNGYGIYLSGGSPIIKGNVINGSIQRGIYVKAGRLILVGATVYNNRLQSTAFREGVIQIGGTSIFSNSLCNGTEANCITNNTKGGIYLLEISLPNIDSITEDNVFSGNGLYGNNAIQQNWYGLFELLTNDKRRTDIPNRDIVSKVYDVNKIYQGMESENAEIAFVDLENFSLACMDILDCPDTGDTSGVLGASNLLTASDFQLHGTDPSFFLESSRINDYKTWGRIIDFIIDQDGNKTDYGSFYFDQPHLATDYTFTFDGNSTNDDLHTGLYRSIDGHDYYDRGEPWTDNPTATGDPLTADYGRFQIMEVEVVDANPVLQEDGSYVITVDSTSDEDNVSTCGFDQGEGVYSGGGCGGVDGLPDGKTSLREAIHVANNFAQPVTIEFNIPTSDPNWNNANPNAFTIEYSAYPPNILAAGLTIDGNSQTRFTGDTNLAISEPEIMPVIGNSTTGPEVIIQAPNLEGIFQVYAPNVTIDRIGFKDINFLTNPGGRRTIQSFSGGDNFILRNCTFSNTGGGNYVARAYVNGVEISNNIFQDSLDTDRDALELQFANIDNLYIHGNQFINNRAAAIALLNFTSTTDILITENLFKQNSYNGTEIQAEIYTLNGNTTNIVVNNNVFVGSQATPIVVKGEPNNVKLYDNKIFDFANSGIDIVPLSFPGWAIDGATANDSLDSDTGPNDLQNYPTIDTVTYLGAGQYLVSGDLDGAVGENPFDIEICESYDHPSNHGGCLQTLAHVTANSPWSSLVTIAGSNGSDNRYLSTLATNTNGSTSEFSENFYLDTTNPDYTVADYNISLITPANNSTITDKTPAFDWSESSFNSITNPEVTKYRIYLDNILLAETTTSNYIPTVDLSLGTHTWNVKAYNASNTEVDTSATYTFTIEEITNTDEYTITPISPLTDTQLDDTTPIFDWEDTNYTLSPNDSIEYEIYIDDTLITTTTESELDCDNYTDLCTLTEGNHTWYVVAYVVTKDPNTLETLEREEIGRTQIQSFNILQTQELSLENIPVEEESPITEETNLKLLSDETLIATVPLAAISTVMLLTTLLSGNIQTISNYGVVGVLFGWVVRKRRKYTGIIKQKGTEQRIGLATIRVYRKEVEMNKSGFIEQSMSDLEGRYLIKKEEELEKQDYYIEVIAKGYKTQEIQVSQDRTKLPKVIELEREENINQRKIRVSIQHISLIIKVVDVLLTVVVIVGLIYTVYATIENPSILNYMLIVIYLVIVIGNIVNLLIRKKIK